MATVTYSDLRGYNGTMPGEVPNQSKDARQEDSNA